MSGTVAQQGGSADTASPIIGDILGVSVDELQRGGTVQITGANLTVRPDGSDLRVEAFGTGSHAPVPLHIEKFWRDSFAIVSLPQSAVCPAINGQPCPFQLRVFNAHGSTVSPFVNAPEINWVQPFARAGESADVFGRRFWGTLCVLMVNGTAGKLFDDNVATPCLPARIVNENRLRFDVPASFAPGATTIALRDTAGRIWNGSTVASGLGAMDVLTIVPVAPTSGLAIDASLAPYSVDPSGLSDATGGLYSAILAASANGTRPGGIVSVGPGTFLFNSTAGCHIANVFTAICELPKEFAVTVIGSGMEKTVFQVGSGIGSLFQATPVSLRDLTVTDKLPDGPTSAAAGAYNQSRAYGSSLIGLDWASAGTSWNHAARQSASLLGSGLDWQMSVGMNNTDLSLERVHVISMRAAATISFGNTQRMAIRDSIFDGGCVWFNAPMRDLRMTGNLIRNGGLGNGWGGSGMSIRLGGGHYTGLIFENNTFDHLVKNLSNSGFSGRFFVMQHGLVDGMYFANNTNLRAGPGALSQQNSGEQILWETLDTVPLLQGDVESTVGNIVTMRSAAAISMNSSDSGWVPLESFYNRVGGKAAAKGGFHGTGVGNNWGYNHANADFLSYCHLDDSTGQCTPRVSIGLVHIVQGRGTGQTRRIMGFGTENNRTLVLDREFTVAPDSTSVLSLTGFSMVDLIARDISIRGGLISKVASPDGTATTAVDVWDSGHRLTYSNFDCSDIRNTIGVNAWRNTTVSDVVIKHIKSSNTRVGVSIGTQGKASDNGPHTVWDANNPVIGLSIRDVVIDGIPEGRFDDAKPQEGYGAGSEAAGGLVVGVSCGYRAVNEPGGTKLNSSGTSFMVVEDVTIKNASIAINYPAVCGTGVPPQNAVILTPHRFAAALIRNVTATGGNVGLLLNDNVSNPASGLVQYDITTTGFKHPVNISWDPRFLRPYDNAQWYNNSWVMCWQVGSRSTHGDCNMTLPIMQPQLQLLTPSVLAVPSDVGSDDNWTATVEFRNAGLAAGRFVLEDLDPRLVASTASWEMQARTPTAAEPVRLLLSPKSGADLRSSWDVEGAGPACGVLSDGDSSARFCVLVG